MASPDPTLIAATPKPQILRVFISYTREDERIADAVFNALRTALGTFADVFIDNSLRFGLSFLDEIKKRLDDTDLLVVIDSSTPRPAFSYTGIELGYFMGVMGQNQDPERPRRIVPFYQENPPDMIAEKEGIKIGISRATLAMSLDEYAAQLKIDSDHPMVRFLAEFQEIADRLRERNGFPKVMKRPEEEDLCGLVRTMQLSIFSHLKTTPELTLKPQKQITIRTSDAALESAGTGLPLDAKLVPIGAGNPLAIFALPDEEISWCDFSNAAENSKFGDSWIDAISNVVASSLQGQMDVDNSQVILSNDGAHAFRVILTTGTRYFNGVREFNLYFVEYLNRKDFGDKNTSLALKGLELCCRFRFLFLEMASEFSHMSIRMCSASAFRDTVRNMERELNLFKRDALEAGLDRPNIWLGFVDCGILQKIGEEWRPLEVKIRECFVKIRNAKDDSPGLAAARETLADALEEMQARIQPLNTELICGMTDTLKRLCSCV